MAPTGVFLFAPDAALELRVLPQQVQREFAERRQVLGRMARAHPALVFIQRHVEHPVQLVLHGPELRPRTNRVEQSACSIRS